MAYESRNTIFDNGSQADASICNALSAKVKGTHTFAEGGEGGGARELFRGESERIDIARVRER